MKKIILYRAHSPSRPFIIRIPCSNVGKIYKRLSRTALGLPGRLMISVLPRITLTALLSIARGVMVRLYARMASYRFEIV